MNAVKTIDIIHYIDKYDNADDWYDHDNDGVRLMMIVTLMLSPLKMLLIMKMIGEDDDEDDDDED